MFIDRIVDVPVVLKKTEYPDKVSDVTEVMQMLQPTRMKETAKVHQAQFLKEMKVPEIMQRQVPMIQEEEKDQAFDLKTNKAEAQLNKVESSADTGSSERSRTPQRSSQEREREGSTRHEDRSILAHTSESRCAR